jgi:hypothetical protein
MTGQLREDEKFVMDAISKTFSGTWRCGEYPPDAYLMMDNRKVAVEISTLIDSRPNGRGGTVSRASDVMPASQLVNEVEEELRDEIPEGRGVSLVLKSPFLNKRAVKGPLKARIRDLLSHPTAQRIQETFSGNEIEISISNNGAKNIVGLIVPSSLPRYDLLTTAWCILEERIAAKAETCRALKFDHPIWLALRNGYPPADVEMYRQAMNLFSVNHPFEKILLISRDGTVDELLRPAPNAK